MNSLVLFIIGAMQITILDLTLCGDNIGIIALATNNLPDKYCRKASLIGIIGAVVLRIIFACAITLIISSQWLPIKLVGGVVLIKITWDFIKPECQANECTIKNADSFWGAVAIIIIADISMSLDNVLAIASTANGKVLLIIFGVLLNIPIIFFGSQFVSNLMKKHRIVIYIGAAILAHTSVKMILEDNLTIKYIHLQYIVMLVIPWFFAMITLFYGFILIKRSQIIKDASDGKTGKLCSEVAITINSKSK